MTSAYENKKGTAMAEMAAFTSGYFGPGHRNSIKTKKKADATNFIATFKHSLLFNKKIMIADHMTITDVFKKAYRSDGEFRKLFIDELVDLAHIDKYYDGRAFTLVEYRKFITYINASLEKRDSLDPRSANCPSDPFDDDLEAIQKGVRRIYPDGTKRDPLFTKKCDDTIECKYLQDVFGDFYMTFVTSYEQMRGDYKEKGYYLGVINFDESDKPPATDTIFDYMKRKSSLSSISRADLVDKFGDKIARFYRTLFIESELEMIGEAHAILPPELAEFREFARNRDGFYNGEGHVVNNREKKIDLTCINPYTLSALSFIEIKEIRKYGEDFFALIEAESGNENSFDDIWKSLFSYCKYINARLGDIPVTGKKAPIAKNIISLVQRTLNRHDAIKTIGVETIYNVACSVAHAGIAAGTGYPETSSVVDDSLKLAKESTYNFLSNGGIDGGINDLKSRISLPGHDGGGKVMFYE